MAAGRADPAPPGHGLAAAIIGGSALALLALATVGLAVARLPATAGGVMAVAFPPAYDADARLLAIARAGGRQVRFTAIPGVLIARPDEDDDAGFAGRLVEAGAIAAFPPAAFAPFAFGGCVGSMPSVTPTTQFD